MITLTGHSGVVYCTSFNPDESLLLSSSEDGTGNDSNWWSPYNVISIILQFVCGVYWHLLLSCVSEDTTILYGLWSLGNHSGIVPCTIKLLRWKNLPWLLYKHTYEADVCIHNSRLSLDIANALKVLWYLIVQWSVTKLCQYSNCQWYKSNHIILFQVLHRD